MSGIIPGASARWTSWWSWRRRPPAPVGTPACSRRDTLRVAGEEVPQSLVRERLLSLTGEHLAYVLDCLGRNTSQVRNVRQYLITALFNAPVTMENGYAAQVSHDLYREPALMMSPLNLIITVHAYGVPRDVVVAGLIPVTIPFNLLKAALNAIIFFLLYQALGIVFKKKA